MNNRRQNKKWMKNNKEIKNDKDEQEHMKE